MPVKANRVVCKAAARRVIWSALAAAALSLLGASAHAEGELQRRVVSYADLDLSRPHGARVLYVRLQKAAREVCGPRYSRDLRQVMLHRACYEQALADAVASVNKTSVTALYRADRTIKIVQRAAKRQARS